MENERALIQQILNGDTEAFRSLVANYQRLVGHIVFRMVPQPADHEDLCQDVFLKVYQNLASFGYQSKLSTWIGRIAYTTCLNYLKKKRVPLFDDTTPEHASLEHQGGTDDPSDRTAVRTDLSQRLRQEVDGLPLKYRTILTLYHLDQLSYAEIGAIMDLPEGTVKSHLFRARKLLKERLMNKYPQEELWP